MKRLGIVALVLCTIGIAWAAVSPVNIDGDGRWSKAGIWIGTTSTETTQANRLAKRLGGASTVDFTSLATGVQFSSAITKAGAAVGDICTASAPAVASALNATFSCVVTATDEVKVIFEPKNMVVGVATFDGGSPAQIDVTVPASSVCTCTPVGSTAAIAGNGCAVGLTSTTLTLTGPNSATTTVNYNCAAPVDPASGSYAYQLTRNGS